MRGWRSIFAIAPDCHATNTGYYARLWRRHFYDGMVSAGVQTTLPEGVDFSWSYHSSVSAGEETASRSRCAEQLQSQILQAIEAGTVEVVISYARSNQIDAELVAEIQRRGIPWINFFCDSVSQFEDVRDLAAACSLNWFPESTALTKYQALGRPVLCRPYVLNPEALPFRAPTSAPERKVGFVGLPSTNRVTILSILSLLGCPIDIRGHGWENAGDAAFGGQEGLVRKLRRALLEPHRLERIWRRFGWRYLRRKVHGALDDEGLRQFLAESQIVLGLNEARTPEGRLVSYLKFRDLEMPASGCCYLTQANPDIVAILEPGKEVLTFRGILEARAAIDFHLRRPELCRRIGNRARERILREHVWSIRLNELKAALN